MNPGTMPLHIHAPLSAPMKSSRITDGITVDMLDMIECSICAQEILYTPIAIAAAIPAEMRRVSWLAPESVSTPNETTEKKSITTRNAIGIRESQADGVGISLYCESVFILILSSQVIAEIEKSTDILSKSAHKPNMQFDLSHLQFVVRL